MRSTVIVILALVLLIVPLQVTAQVSPDQPIVLTNANPDTIGFIARVNELQIPQEKFDRELLRRTESATEDEVNEIAIQVLNALVEQALINQSATDLDITVTDEQLDTEIDSLRSSIAEDEESWNNWLEINQYTEQELRDAIYDALITLEVRDYLAQGLTGVVPHVRARHILLRTEDDANFVMEQFDSGIDFVDLAIQYSADETTRESGGDLGWFVHDELTDQTLADVVFGLQPGEVAGPVESSIGFHVVQALEFSDREIEPERIPTLIENQFLNWISSLYDGAEIEIYLLQENQ